MRITVLGAGAGGQGVAVLCVSRGHDVTVCDRFGAAGGHSQDGSLPYAGILGEGAARVRVRAEPAEAVEDANLVCVATTAQGQHWALDAVARAGVSDQAVVLLSGLMGSALWPDGGDDERRLVGETSVFPLSARLEGGLCRIRRLFRPRAAALPGRKSARLAERLSGLFDVQPAGSIVETCLCNPNPLIHAGTMLLNLAYVERAGLDAGAPLEGITPKGVRLIDALDAERCAIGAAYGCALAPVDGLYEEISGRSPAFRESERPSHPQPLQARFLTEDVPYGLALWVSLAAAAGVPAPVTDAVMRLYEVVDPELVAETRTLATLGVPHRGAAQVLAAVIGGADGHH